jgi:hypothetical protein
MLDRRGNPEIFGKIHDFLRNWKGDFLTPD